MFRTFTLLAAVALFVPGLRADDDAKAILARAITAHGGEKALTKYQAATMKAKGTISIPGFGDTEFTQTSAYMLPGKFRESLEMTIGAQAIKVVTRLNGSKVSIEADGNPVPVNDAIKESMKQAAHVLEVGRLVALIKEKGYDLSLAGEVKVEGNPAVGVRVSAKGEKDVSLYFDKKTNLLAKIEHQTTDPMTGNEMTQERIFTEYKKGPEGLAAARKVQVNRDGKKYLEAEVLEVKFLEKLDDSEFQK